MDKKKAWAILKPIKKNGEIVKIFESKFTFGRSEECNLSFPNNKMLSSKHGFIEKHDDDKVWLVDTSRNGIIVNMKKKLNNSKHEILNHEKFYLVYRVDEEEKNIGFQIELQNEKDEEEEKSKDAEPLSKKPKIVSETKTNANQTDDIADTVTCSICQEIMHDCVSLQPCMHTFCSGCYSEWMDKSNLCPICRLKVERISKNHIVNNLIEAYLKLNPNKKRSDESIAELEAKNKITHDMLYPKEKKKAKKRFEEDEEYEYSDEEDEYSDEEDEDEEQYQAPNPPVFGVGMFNYNMNNNNNNNNFGFAQGGRGLGGNFGFGGFPVFNNPNRVYCRQCPNNKINAQKDPKYPDYTCTLIQNHLLCQCCLESMPDRSTDIANNPQIPKQICTVCFKAFCDLYWGCKKADCKKCLAKYQDHAFDETHLSFLINENQHESKILSDYLKSKNKTINSLFNECVRKMRNGVFRSKIINQQFPNEKVVCRNCALKTLQDFSFVYRSEIPKSELPTDVTNRSDCIWGKDCRTQKHNIQHTQRYNHICDQKN